MSIEEIPLSESDTEAFLEYLDKYLKRPDPIAIAYPPHPLCASRKDLREHEKECKEVDATLKYYYNPWMADRELLRQLFALVKKAGFKKLQPEIETENG